MLAVSLSGTPDIMTRTSLAKGDPMTQKTYDYVIIGSGFGGSVAAMRLSEKGYSVLVLEKGKRYNDQDFAKRNWAFWKYLWIPALRAHGILQISIMKGAMVLYGAGIRLPARAWDYGPRPASFERWRNANAAFLPS